MNLSRPVRYASRNSSQPCLTLLVDCSLGGTRQRLGRTVCLIDTSALGHDSPLDNPRNLYCGIDDTVEVLNVWAAGQC